jgi:hypothetical protein
LRVQVLAASALGSAAEWLACAMLPTLTVMAIVVGGGAIRAAAIALVMLYAAQLVTTEVAVGRRDRLGRRLARILACPLATTLFGFGGVIGAIRLVGGGSGVGKTERRHA